MAAMKVGTDSITFGAWFGVSGAGSMLDVGTGTGILALMAAQRAEEPLITAIDIDGPSAREAALNFASSPWSGRLEARHISLQKFIQNHDGGGFDLIVSNPPYYINPLHSPNLQRDVARNADFLPYGELAEAAGNLLSSGGRLAVILPFENGVRFVEVAALCGLNLSRCCHLFTTMRKPARRVMMELTKGEAGNVLHERLLIGGTEWKSLVGEFYLEVKR